MAAIPDSFLRWSFLAVLVLVMTLWPLLLGNPITPRLLAGMTVIGALFWVYGGLAELLIGETITRVGSAPLRLLGGYVLFNSALFVLLMAVPFGVVADVGILAVVGLVIALLRRRTGVSPERRTERRRLPAELLCVIVSVLAATLWCADALGPPRNDGNTVAFRLWQDVFVHIRLISAFAQSHGLGSLADIQASGLTPRVYHYASYASASAVSALTGIEAYRRLRWFLSAVWPGPRRPGRLLVRQCDLGRVAWPRRHGGGRGFCQTPISRDLRIDI